MGDHLLAEEDNMRGTCFADRFGRVLGIVLSGLLMLSVCATASFAEQIETTPEDVVANENPVVETQGTDEVVCQDSLHSVMCNNSYTDDNGILKNGDDY